MVKTKNWLHRVVLRHPHVCSGMYIPPIFIYVICTYSHNNNEYIYVYIYNNLTGIYPRGYLAKLKLVPVLFVCDNVPKRKNNKMLISDVFHTLLSLYWKQLVLRKLNIIFSSNVLDFRHKDPKEMVIFM